MRKAILSLALVFMLALSPVFADSSLGGTIDRTSAMVKKGELTSFQISVFSLKNETMEVAVSAGAVSDLQVNIVPSMLSIEGGTTINPDPTQRWVIIDGDKYARLYPVTVYVRVPQRVSDNRYSIPVTVSTVVSSTSGSGNSIVQKVVQALQYNIEIQVSGSVDDTSNVLPAATEGVAEVSQDYPSYNIPVFGQVREKISSFVESNDILPGNSSDETPLDTSSAEAKPVPSGYLVLGKDASKPVNYLLVLGFIVLAVLITYLLKK